MDLFIRATLDVELDLTFRLTFVRDKPTLKSTCKHKGHQTYSQIRHRDYWAVEESLERCQKSRREFTSISHARYGRNYILSSIDQISTVLTRASKCYIDSSYIGIHIPNSVDRNFDHFSSSNMVHSKFSFLFLLLISTLN